MKIKVYDGGWTSAVVRKSKKGKHLLVSYEGKRDLARRAVKGLNEDWEHPQAVTKFGDCLPVHIS
jgi:hypothetical protein